MSEFILNLIKVNESIDYPLIIAVVIAYFLFIWLVICGWVFFDAKKRYGSFLTPILYFLFVLFGNVPAAIFYIMIRPEHTLEEDYYINLALSGEKELRPIVFDGDRGFDLTLNISVQPKQSEEDKHKMMMNVEWVPQRVEKEQSVKTQQRISTPRKGKVKSFFVGYKEWFKQGGRSFTDQLKGGLIKHKLIKPKQERKVQDQEKNSKVLEKEKNNKK